MPWRAFVRNADRGTGQTNVENARSAPCGRPIDDLEKVERGLSALSFSPAKAAPRGSSTFGQNARSLTLRGDATACRLPCRCGAPPLPIASYSSAKSRRAGSWCRWSDDPPPGPRNTLTRCASASAFSKRHYCASPTSSRGGGGSRRRTA